MAERTAALVMPLSARRSRAVSAALRVVADGSVIVTSTASPKVSTVIVTSSAFSGRPSPARAGEVTRAFAEPVRASMRPEARIWRMMAEFGVASQDCGPAADRPTSSAAVVFTHRRRVRSDVKTASGMPASLASRSVRWAMIATAIGTVDVAISNASKHSSRSYAES